MHAEHIITTETQAKPATTTFHAHLLYRAACSCGWRGCWYADARRIAASQRIHESNVNAQATRGAA